MNEETGYFKILFPLNKIYQLYDDIGKRARTKIDFVGYSANREALENTLALLCDMQFIDEVEGEFIKIVELDEKTFRMMLFQNVLKKHESLVCDILKDIQIYDKDDLCISFNKNSIPLKYGGLTMLFEECGEICSQGYTWKVCGKKLYDFLIRQFTETRLSLDELEKRLFHEKELGLQAEEYVLDFERKRIAAWGLNKEPIQVSLIDVSAGFDILSYDRYGNEKYIEVKSCDVNYKFYISRNEISIAKQYKEKYWLYLYNRFNNTIDEIFNPYEEIFNGKSENWIVETEKFKVHRI